MAGVMAVGFIEGDPRRFIVGQDYMKNYCGLQGDRDEYPMLLYTLNVTNILTFDPSFINKPPVEWVTDVLLSDHFEAFFSPVCVNFENLFASNCPDAKELIKFSTGCLAGSADVDCRTYKTSATSVVRFFSLPQSACPYRAQDCTLVPATYMNALGTFCIPKLITKDAAEDIAEGVWRYVPQKWVGNWWQYWAAMEVAWPLIPLMAVMALVIAILYLLMLQLFAEAVVVIAVLVVLLSLVAGSVGLFVVSIDRSIALLHSQRTIMFYGSFVMFGVAIIYTAVMLCLCRMLREGAAILRCSSQFMSQTPTVYLVPLVGWLINITVFCAWLVGASYVLSVDSRPREVVIGAFVGCFFMLLWISAFAVAATQLTLAGTVVWWYFSPENDHGMKIAMCAPVQAAWMTGRYHLGSIAFGSLIMALVRLVKWFLRWLQHQAAATTAAPSKACVACLPCGIGHICGALSGCNTCFVWIIWSLSYLVECFERCIEYINKVAYIQMALYGYNFCRSAITGFKLIVGNAGKFAFAACMACLLKWLGALAIVAITTASGWFITVAVYDDRIVSPAVPTLAYFGVSVIVAITVLNVITISIEASLQSYLADLKEHAGNARYTPAPLKAWVNAASSKKMNKYICCSSCCCCCVGTSATTKEEYELLQIGRKRDRQIGGQNEREETL
eukprot:GHVS01035762.1.p1 GENE.GHVS01035762.1~~GHVS01035762.1.p1  ORF type:complete len:701 (+),score=55.47 GHVS01035762.1:87-2105(+)